MNKIWVTNSSPIIVLAKIGRLDLVVEKGYFLATPRAVADEILCSPLQDPARDEGSSGFTLHPPNLVYMTDR